MSNRMKTLQDQLLMINNSAHMKMADYVKIYNQHADKPVKKFDTVANAQRRTMVLVESLLAAEQAKPTKAVKTSKFSISAKCKELILAGKTNEEAANIMIQDFGLPAEKSWYVGWNRNALKRAGLLPNA